MQTKGVLHEFTRYSRKLGQFGLTMELEFKRLLPKYACTSAKQPDFDLEYLDKTIALAEGPTTI